jgi:hypothetical protein
MKRDHTMRNSGALQGFIFFYLIGFYLTRHSTTFDMDKIANSNLLIVTNGSTQKTLSFDFALNDFCNQVGTYRAILFFMLNLQISLGACIAKILKIAPS